ncbi:hypothetical protein [Fulvivirga sp.]|jgi:uridine kinase|uniref:hypothetical protein n=1 Tax=Fulvivirga sp. TaxID=1931237 RepID=UPI0032F04619
MIIGIAGVSRSGKTTLAISLKEKLGDAEIVSLDNYPASIEKFQYINDVIDWEHPSSLDLEKVTHLVREAASKNKYVIVEGIFLFYYQPLMSLINKLIFLNLEKTDFLKRKLHDNRWGQIPTWYKEHIWQSHLDFGTKPVDAAILELDATQKYDFDQLLAFINT